MAWGEAGSLPGAVQQLVRLTSSGYRYFVTDVIPPGKDPRRVDVKLDSIYELSLSEDQRYRRRKLGRANVMHVRLERLFVLIATPPYGAHRFFKREANKLRDIHKSPLHISGYSLKRVREGSKPVWRTCVRLEQAVYQAIRAGLLRRADASPTKGLEETFSALELLWYKPVQHQVAKVFWEANRARKWRGLAPLDRDCLPFRMIETVSFDDPA